MNIQLVGQGVEIDDRIKEIIDTKVGEELEKYLHDVSPDLRHASIKLEKLAHGGFNVTFDMHLPGSNGHIYSEESGDDLLNVIIALRKEVQDQIRDYKDKLQDYHA